MERERQRVRELRQVGATLSHTSMVMGQYWPENITAATPGLARRLAAASGVTPEGQRLQRMTFDLVEAEWKGEGGALNGDQSGII